MKNITIAGKECIFYENNLNNDNLVLIKYDNKQVTTKQLKLNLDNIIEFISHTLTIGSIIDSELDKYKTALTVLKSLRLIFNKVNHPIKPPSKTDVKTTIDVITEISLANEKDEKIRNSIKITSIFTQFMIGND